MDEFYETTWMWNGKNWEEMIRPKPDLMLLEREALKDIMGQTPNDEDPGDPDDLANQGDDVSASGKVLEL